MDSFDRKAQLLLPLLIEQAIDHAFILLDPEGNVVGWRGGARDIFGYEADEILGQYFGRLFVPDDIAQGVPETEIRTASTETSAEDDRWMLRKDGGRFWAAGVVRALRAENGTILGFGKVLRDRSDYKGRIEALENSVHTLRKRDEHKNVFLATLSHELRNPLAPLTNAVQLLRLAGSDQNALQQTSKIVERQVEVMRRLVDDLLDITRIGAGKMQLEFSPIVVQELIRRAIDSTASLVQQRDHDLRVIMPEPSLVLDGDFDRLHQVLVNLITNAAKYTPPGGIIWVKVTTEGSEVAVHVDDNGVGITPDLQPQIFNLFTQAETPLTKSGLGIGLALVRQLVTLHGGTVQVRSEGIGKGSHFSVRLPRKQQPSVTELSEKG